MGLTRPNRINGWLIRTMVMAIAKHKVVGMVGARVVSQSQIEESLG